jgi:hypothetical protein
MATSDFLKAALEKKKASQKQSGQKNSKDDNHGIHGSQVNVNKPAKKSAGRGR